MGYIIARMLTIQPIYTALSSLSVIKVSSENRSHADLVNF